MDNMKELLRVKVIKGRNLAVRDIRTSDPYVVLRQGRQYQYMLRIEHRWGEVLHEWDQMFKPVRGGSSSAACPSVEKQLRLLRVRVVKGIHLAVRDISTSDPYVFLRILTLKTKVVKKNVNPLWNEDLTLSIAEPTLPIRLEVFDKDTLSQDDRMVDAELDIQPFIEAVKMNMEGTPRGTLLNKLVPSRYNCLAEESRILWADGKVVQDVCLRLRNIECGEVELHLQWISLSGRPSE